MFHITQLTTWHHKTPWSGYVVWWEAGAGLCRVQHKKKLTFFGCSAIIESQMALLFVFSVQCWRESHSFNQLM
jgi:hypothetical protein